MRIFLSCVSQEFGSYRRLLTDHLRSTLHVAVRDGKIDAFEIRTQEDFQQGSFTLLENIAAYVANSDVVIHLVGDVCGATPDPDHVRSLLATQGAHVRGHLPNFSYTQWEYKVALQSKRRLLCYFANADALRDCIPADVQTVEDAARQEEHKTRIRKQGDDRRYFSDSDGLYRTILYDLGLSDIRKINNMPYSSIGSLFKGRTEFLERLKKTLGRMQHMGHRQIAAITASATTATIHGLGGVGKTRAAVEFAHASSDSYTALLFVAADSPKTFRSSVAKLTSAAILNLAEKDIAQLEAQFESVTLWLKDHPGWFLIIDNVDRPETAEVVSSWLARLEQSGQTVITSRLRNWPSGMETLALDLLTPESATEFLLERTAGKRRTEPDDVKKAQIIAREVDRLSLALEQAGALIAHMGYSFAEYLTEWKKNKRAVLSWSDSRVMQYPNSIATTWKTSFAQLPERGQSLLDALAWFSSEPIPLSILDGRNRSKSREALADLVTLSLAEYDGNGDTFQIHRLVQEITRSMLPQGDALYVYDSLVWMDTFFRGNRKDILFWRSRSALVPHAVSLARFGDEAFIAEPTIHLMNEVATLLSSEGRHEEAEPLNRRVVQLVKKVYGEHDGQYSVVLSNLALVLLRRKKLAEATKLMERACSLDEVDQNVDPETKGNNLNNLAGVFTTLKKPEKAEPLLKRAIAIMQKAKLDGRPLAASAYSNLAGVQEDLGHTKEAEASYRRALAIERKYFGATHPALCTTLGNLGSLLTNLGRYAEAAKSLRRALSIYERHFGLKDKAISEVLGKLSTVLKNGGKLREAIRVMERALSINVELYGVDSSRVLAEQLDLARMMWSARRFEEAKGLLEKTIATLHTDPALADSTVVDALGSLAEFLADTQTSAAAAAYVLREFLDILEGFPRRDNSKIAQTLQRLAEMLHEIGRSEEAETCIRRAIRISEKANRDVLRIAEMYALIAQIQEFRGHPRDAVRTLRHAIGLRKRMLGTQYPDLQYDLLTLAEYSRHAGRKAAAKKCIYEAILVVETTDGKSVSFASLLGSAAMQLRECGDRIGAIACLRRVVVFDKRSKSANQANFSFPIGYLAQCLYEIGKNREAETLVRRAIEIDLANLGNNLVDYGVHLASLSRILAAQNKYPESVEAIKQAIRVDGKHFGRRDIRVAMSMSLLAMLYQKLGRPADALRLMRQHVEMLIANENNIGKRGELTYMGILKYGALLRMQGKTENEVQAAIHALTPRLGSDVEC